MVKDGREKLIEEWRARVHVTDLSEPENLLRCVFCAAKYGEGKEMMLGWWEPKVGPGQVFMVGLYCCGGRCLPSAAATGRLRDMRPQPGMWARLVGIAETYQWEGAALSRLIRIIGALESGV